MKRWLLVVALCLVSGLLASPGWTCDVANVCSDIALSLRGDISGDNVVISWETDSEGTDISHYEVYRFDCEEPECLDYVGIVDPAGECEQTEPYEVHDTPPSPVSSWTYQVRVITKTATTQCSINVEPE